MRTVVWFRDRDLRVGDHAPLLDAAAGGEVIPLFVLEPALFTRGAARVQPHRVQFLIEALRELRSRLAALGSELVLAEGAGADVVPALAARWQVDRVVAHGSVDPAARERDARVQAAGVRLDLFEGETLVPPGTLRTAAGTPYWVYGAFARAFERDADIARPRPAPASLPPVPDGIAAASTALPELDALGVARNERILAGGEGAAHDRLARFLAAGLAGYASERDRLDRDGTSRISADLRFGTISARAVWDAVARARGDGAVAFRRELVWREFAHGALHERPALLREPFRADFAAFPWADPQEGWEAWAVGRTGYPLVDAAARQLLAEGFVHNRARMIAASFLTRQLRIDYRLGEAHYMTHLTDGDPAQNNAGWQWCAGCGLDAQPWFRIFNPVLQGARFDPEGTYVRRWVSELAAVPARWIHRPWQAPAAVLDAAGVSLGESYPEPVVELSDARERYLRIARGHLGRSQGVGEPPGR